MSMLPEQRVVVAMEEGAFYPAEAPFHPAAAFPEYRHGKAALSGANPVYTLVRTALRDLGLDEEAFGTAAWNPLGALVSPGRTVLIKPNLVLHAHPRGGDLCALVTHGSVVRAVLDYVHLAVGDAGRVLIGDAPLQGTDFDEACRVTGLRDVIAWYRQHTDMDIHLVDFRQVHARIDRSHHVLGWDEVPGDPLGCVTYELGRESALAPLGADSERFRISNYRAEDTLQYHNPHGHKYVVARSVPAADLIISVPKMKTHCKVGVTLGMKNFVGVVGRKQCLAHHRQGGAAGGGDEYPGRSRLKELSVALETAIDGNVRPLWRNALKLAYRANERLIRTLGLDPIRDGGWYGNDTCWRMVVDLARIVLYGRGDGSLDDRVQRRVLTLVDGVVAGENEGPLEATPVAAGCCVAGLDLFLTDVVTATLMGLDYRRIPMLREMAHWTDHPVWTGPGRPEDVEIRMQGESMGLNELAHHPARLSLRPAEGWSGHIEMHMDTGAGPAPDAAEGE